MTTTIVINSIRWNNSCVDGPGIRTVLFLQGCPLRCEGCQNKTTWNIDEGKKMSIKELVFELNKNCFNKKITISGGEPLFQRDELIILIDELFKLNFDIALYTGYEKEYVPEEVLKKIKYLKTGAFKQKLKTTIKPFVGSDNQLFEEVNNDETSE